MALVQEKSNKIKGLEVLLYVNVPDAQGTPVKTVVAGQRGATLSMTADDIDVTDKTTEGYKAFLAGLKEWNISCDGLVCIDDVGYKALVDAFLAGEVIEVDLRNGDYSFGYRGLVAISSMDFDAQYDDALTYACELKGASALYKIDPDDPDSTSL
jgi:TP901-1 family phage major tail protein